MEKQQSMIGVFVKGLLLGGVVFGTLALFTAPHSGAETRQMIRAKGEETRQMIREKGEDLRDKTTETLENVRAQVDTAISDVLRRTDTVAEVDLPM